MSETFIYHFIDGPLSGQTKVRADAPFQVMFEQFSEEMVRDYQDPRHVLPEPKRVLYQLLGPIREGVATYGEVTP